MSITIQTDPLVLRDDSSGALRIGQSRVLVEIVFRAFQDGATPESILQCYPSLSLADVYTVIAYYLQHRTEMEAYMADRERLAEEVRQRIDSGQGDLANLRSRMLAHRSQ